jgi:hypothetical protein
LPGERATLGVKLGIDRMDLLKMINGKTVPRKAVRTGEGTGE